MDQILKKAMGKRDGALREAERWEGWIKTYVELADPLETPMSSSAAPPRGEPADDLDIPSAVKASAVPAEGNVSKGLLLRNGTAN